MSADPLMAEDKREGPPDPEVQAILSDLDAILSDLGGGQGPTPQSEDVQPPPAPTPAAKPASPPPAPAVKPAEPAPAPAQPAPKSPPELSIELGARPAPSAPPAAKPPEPVVLPPKAAFFDRPPLELGAKRESPQPAQPAAPAPARPPVSPANGGTPPAGTPPELQLPAQTGKDQVRRVAFLYVPKFEAEREALAKLLDETARTVPKKPLFLRRVLYQAVTPSCDVKEVLARVAQAKAVAALALVESLPEPKLRELSEAFAAAGLMFRTVAPLDAGKKSMAIDIVVDIMLLAHEP